MCVLGAPVGQRRKLGRELVEFAALFFAVGTADLFANTLAHRGPVLLFGLGLLLVVAAVVHRGFVERRGAPKPAAAARPRDNPPVWRVRATVPDSPGSLAALTASLSAHQINIASIQVCAVPSGAVDELMVEAPAEATAEQLRAAVRAGGGADVHAEPADRHDLVDVPTQVLAVAGRSLAGGSSLPEALRTLFGCSVVAAPRGGSEGISGTTMRLRDPQDRMLALERPAFPFTSAEWARARAFVGLHRDTREGTPPADPADTAIKS